MRCLSDGTFGVPTVMVVPVVPVCVGIGKCVCAFLWLGCLCSDSLSLCASAILNLTSCLSSWSSCVDHWVPSLSSLLVLYALTILCFRLPGVTEGVCDCMRVHDGGCGM